MNNPLRQNIEDQIVEAQLKLGYAKETVRLYYMPETIRTLWGDGSLQDVIPVLEKEMPEFEYRISAGRLEIQIPDDYVEYVHKEKVPSEFLKAFIHVFQTDHHCDKEQLEAVFAKFSDHYQCHKVPESAGFDYVLYFEDPQIDPYYYCIKEEMNHTIYHRFFKADYEKLLA